MDERLITVLPNLLKMKAEEYKDKVAFIDETREITYSGLDENTSLLAKGIIELGIQKNDRVLTYMWNSIDLVELYFGLPRAGAVCVFTNPALMPREMNHMLVDSKARAIVTDLDLYEKTKDLYNNLSDLEFIIITGDTLPKNVPHEKKILKFGDLKIYGPLEKDLERKKSDPAWIQYTSGTTGTPKGAELSHGALTHVTSAVIEALALNDEDIVLATLPLFHSYASNLCMLVPVGAGATTVIEKAFSPVATPETVKRHGVTFFPAVPTMITYMLHSKIPVETLSSLKIMASGGAILPNQLRTEFERIYGIEILEGWGATETCSVSTINPLNAPAKPAESCGVAIPGVDVRVFDENGKEVPRGQEGEMVIKGPNVMTCYINKPEATADAMKYGYYWTGDIAVQDENGYIFIKGRSKEMIISGGYNIYPKELEDVLLDNESILEVAVVGVEDEDKGEVPKAVCVLKEQSRLTEEDIIAYLKENVAKYKQPGYVDIVDSLPKTAAGKVKKFMLK